MIGTAFVYLSSMEAFMKKVTLTIAALTLLTIAACSPKKQGVRSTYNRSAVSTGVVNNTNINTNSCGQGVSPVGTIYDQGNTQTSLYTSGSFEERVKGLLSVTVNPEEVGQISSSATDTTGVRFQGAIKVDANGNVNLQQSSLLIKVYDSYVLQYPEQFQPIEVSFATATSGQFNMQNGQGYILFRDQYGEVRFDGTMDAQYFSGTVSYKNYSHISGAAPAQGQLGQFYVARCGIFK